MDPRTPNARSSDKDAYAFVALLSELALIQIQIQRSLLFVVLSMFFVMLSVLLDVRFISALLCLGLLSLSIFIAVYMISYERKRADLEEVRKEARTLLVDRVIQSDTGKAEGLGVGRPEDISEGENTVLNIYLRIEEIIKRRSNW